MTNRILAENFKRFRIAKGMTQEQTAEALHINAQTVSRWECATTLPDIITLSELAKLYGVTVDDFYRKHSVAYDNYAQRLSSVYEKTRDPEDFLRCFLEYQRLMKSGELSAVDKWNYATIHHFMLRYCKDTALEWYNKAIADGAEHDPFVHGRARSLRSKLLFELGRGDEVICQQKEACGLHLNDPQEWVLLMEAYILANQYENAYAVFLEATEKFPENWTFYIHGGDICQALKKYDEAFQYWDKAGELGTDFYDEYYCKASCYDDMGEYEKAYHTYLELADQLRRNGYDVETEMAEAEAEKIKRKMK